jgi:hypothetical protein
VESDMVVMQEDIEGKYRWQIVHWPNYSH